MKTKRTESEGSWKIKVFVVEDHLMLREGIRAVINSCSDMEVCDEAADAHTALSKMETRHPDVALVDLSLKRSHGMDLIKDMSIRLPKVHALVLSMKDETLYAELALRAGAEGYIQKDSSGARIVDGIREVMAGRVFVSGGVVHQMMNKTVAPDRSAPTIPPDDLSNREVEVRDMIENGLGTGVQSRADSI